MSVIETNHAIEAAVRLGTLIAAHARDVGRRLGDSLRRWLRHGEVLPDFTLVLELPARSVRHAAQGLRERQSELDEARGQEAEARLWRDHTAAALRRKLVQVRRLLTSVFGPQRTATLLDTDGRTASASQHALLLSQAEAFGRLLRDPKRLATPDAADYFDPAAAAAALEPLAVALREACGHLDETRQASAARLAAKNRARAELEHAVRGVAGILRGWLVLVRRPDLAEKLRLARCRAKTRCCDKTRRPGKAGKATNRSRKEVPM